ncbi:hypothetical protein [Prosthecobacter sp.]|uniref:hypothetical protein n=1 Tax=Prosthecobacter sp. TaxID=1965333 RepID=UPI0037838E37
MNAHRHESTPLVRLVHLLLLAGWLLSSHGVAPAVCLAAAVLDGDHAVKVGRARDGSLTVVLSHEGKSCSELMAHQHDALCRMLVAFAKAPASGAEDHVLAFKPVNDASRTHRPLPSMGTVGKASAPLQVLAFNPFKTPAASHAGAPVRRDPWSREIALKPLRTVMRC